MATANGACTACTLPIARVDERPLLQRAADQVFGWMQRAEERRMLGELDERMLRDVGIDRAALLLESEKPFWRP